MDNNKAQQHYRKTQIMTASPAQLLLMLYDAAIVAMDTAIAELEKRSLRYDIVNNNLIKAQEIIGELLSTLDFQQAPDIAKNLESLYHYFMRKLMEGNLKKDIYTIEEVRDHMKVLKDGWDKAVTAAGAPATQVKATNPPLQERPTKMPPAKKPSTLADPSKKGGFNIQG